MTFCTTCLFPFIIKAILISAISKGGYMCMKQSVADLVAQPQLPDYFIWEYCQYFSG